MEKFSLSEEEIAFSEIIGDLVEQWGFKRHLGRIWSLIYLRQSPQSPTLMQQELSLSAGAVSSALSELQTWGVVKRIHIAGDRNFYYESEQHLWKAIANVLRTRELRILEQAHVGLRILEETLDKKSKHETTFQIKRIRHVKEAVHAGFSLALQLVDFSPITLPKARNLLKRLKSF
jgi:DNA-binding transcriptional regulator GbsR (MarR family)